MTTLKTTYVDLVQATARSGSFSWLERLGRDAAPYGWRRWAASLLAIYDTERMLPLDVPWWNVAATRTVEQFLAARPGARVFEYGAGASTVWLARRAGQVVSVEHDGDWYARFRGYLTGYANAQLLQRDLNGPGRPYVEAIDAYDQFDLIVVDGRQRAECLAAAIPHLAPGGLIVFDDSGRRRYRAAIERCGLAEQHFYGRSFCVPYPDHTSLLSRRG